MKNRLLSIALAAMLSLGIFSAPVQEYIGSSSVAEAAAAVSVPKASKKAGTYSTSGAFTVKLTSATSGAKIYYSTGSGYKLYTKALKISKNTTIKCYAEKNGVKSKTVSLAYKLTPTVTVSATSGTYSEPITVKLSSTASGVKFYYTLDGSKPTTKSTLYSTKGIAIDSSRTLCIAAVKSGWSTKYITRKYVIESADSSVSGDSILDDYSVKYAYNTLNSTQKKLYAALFKGVSKHSSSIDVSGINATTSDLNKAYWAFDYENPQFFWLSDGYSYSYSGNTVLSVDVQYSRTKSEADKIAPKLEAAAKKITDKAPREKGLFEQVKYLHDAVTEMTEYTKSGPSYKAEADGPLLHGVALCEGYSKAFMYLCQSVGIECICVSGYAGEGHMWNMLKLDGEWYNMDVTWDDPVGGLPNYTYFCIPTSKIKSDHTFENTFTVPSATATKYSYAEVMGINDYNTLNTAYNGLLNEAAANYKKGVTETTIYISGSFMSSLVSKVGSQDFYRELTAKGCKFSGWSYRYTDSMLTLTLT